MKKLLIYLFVFLSFKAYSTPLNNEVFKEKEFTEFINYVFATDNKYQTDGLYILKSGKPVYERYGHGFSAKMPHLFWSVAKSFTSAVVGVAQQQGLLNINEKVAQYYPHLNNSEGHSLTLQNLMQMSSGLDWNEGYESNPLKSDVIKMLYISGFEDMALFTSQHNFKTKPNESFYYSSGDTNLVMGFLKNRLGKKYNDFPWEFLFDKLGMESVTWEQDKANTFVGSSYIYMTPADAAKFGQLYLQDGVWNEERILPEGWVKLSQTIAPTFNKTVFKGNENRESYGLGWWLNKDLPLKNEKRPFPNVSENFLMASGHHGQFIVVIPDQDMVIIRTGLDKKGAIDKNIFFTKLLGSLK